MKVAQLKAILETLDDEMDIVLQKDPEGNGYSPLSGADPNAVCTTDDGHVDDVYSCEWTADECCLEEDEWAKLKSAPKILILYPMH